MLAGCKRGQNLFRMQMMASGDDDGIDGGILNELGFVGGAITKTEFALDMLRVRASAAQTATSVLFGEAFIAGTSVPAANTPAPSKPTEKPAADAGLAGEVSGKLEATSGSSDSRCDLPWKNIESPLPEMAHAICR